MRILLVALFSVISFVCTAQTKWHNPEKEGAILHGQLLQDQERSNYYHRLPDNVEKNVREAVWGLSKNSAGESIRFYTNSKNIVVRYGVSEAHSFNHMQATGKSGVDLYATDNHGARKWCAARFNFADTITYNYSDLLYTGKMHDLGFEYQLYLPTYNTVQWLEIGVDEGAYFKFQNPTAELPIIVYGTSITQGACASRPGMIWASIVSRELDSPLMNLGFSGNGCLEKGILDVIKKTPARAVLIDCLPNLYKMKKEKIVELTINAVKEIRKSQPGVSIVLVDHLGYPHSKMQEGWHEKVVNSCEANKEAYTQLLKDGYLNLHHLKHNDIAMPEDATVEAIHPSDWGMRVYADAYLKLLRKILYMPQGEEVTQIPVRQRRGPQIYEWIAQHDKKMAEAKAKKAKIVVFGNSLMHQWGGNDNFIFTRDSIGWEKITAGKKVVNMGSGWDRVENLLWRVYHGALDGYTPDKIIVTIGINNINNNNSPEQVAEGIRFLIKAIKARQKTAEIKVCGVFPMRSKEATVVELNKLIEKVASDEGVAFANPGVKLLMTNGKANQSLYQNDGLHLNANGYNTIAEEFFK